jgi:GAF domain-containing protein
MPYDDADLRVGPPVDNEAPRRMARLHELGIGTRPEAELDVFAAKLASTFQAPYAMVNFVRDDYQYFAGLYAQPGTKSEVALQAAEAVAASQPDRVMGLDHGYCPHVVDRSPNGLVLDDVMAWSRFAGNPVVDGALHVRAYMGAPLIDQLSGVTLGTICVVDNAQHAWGGKEVLPIFKELAAEAVDLIHQRARRA